MVTTTHVEDTPAASIATLVAIHAQAATQTDNPHLRRVAAFSLGTMKYEDQHHILRANNRNPTEAGQQNFATVRLPHVDAFINTADADNLRRVIDGMMSGLQRYVPRHESQYQPGTDDLIERIREPICDQIDPARLAELDQIQARLIELRWQEVAADLHSDDDVLRDEAAFHIGSLKIINERDLRLFDYTSRRQRWMMHDTRNDLAVIDQLIAAAEADQLREVIAGITSRLYIYEDDHETW
jgi:hypothetical protein